jgi:hypothetical protein
MPSTVLVVVDMCLCFGNSSIKTGTARYSYSSIYLSKEACGSYFAARTCAAFMNSVKSGWGAKGSGLELGVGLGAEHEGVNFSWEVLPFP